MVLYEMDLGLLDGPSSTVQVRCLFLLYRLLTLLQEEKNTMVGFHTLQTLEMSF